MQTRDTCHQPSQSKHDAPGEGLAKPGNNEQDSLQSHFDPLIQRPVFSTTHKCVPGTGRAPGRAYVWGRPPITELRPMSQSSVGAVWAPAVALAWATAGTRQAAMRVPPVRSGC